jgi:hypothetical protein
VIVFVRLLSLRVIPLFACGALAASCVAPPPLTQATNNFPFARSIPIHDVVQRVKCDLTDALYAKVYQSKDRLKFAWMQSWTAKADLTLEIDDTGGITPSVSYTHALPNAFVFGLGPSSINTATGAVTNTVGATSQNLTLGASGTFSGSATRTETLSFNLSMAELKDWKENRQRLINRGLELTGIYSCDPAAPTDVQADLDLRTWLDEALKPVELGDLQTGIHPTPSQSGGTPASSAAPGASTAKGGTKALDEAKQLPKPTILPEEKAFLDLSLSTYLTELEVPYDISDNVYYEPTNQPDKACTTISKEPGKSVTFRPPPYPGSSNSQSSNQQNSQSLVQQSLTNAQSAQSSAAVVRASQTLDAQIKQKALTVAQAARYQALQVQKASQYAAEHVLAVCEADSTYVKADKCISPPPAASVDAKSTKTVLVTSNDHVLIGDKVTLTATVSASASSNAPTGSVTFKDSGVTLAENVALDSRGVASYETTFTAAGTHSITASYNGDLNASEGKVTQIVASNSMSITLTANHNPSNAGDLVAFVAAVTTPGGMPKGSVTFRAKNINPDLPDIVLFRAGLDANGRVSYATSSLPVGTNSIVAEYGGEDFARSAVILQVVRGGGTNPKPIELWSSANPSAAGQLVTFTARTGDAQGHSAPTGYLTFVQSSDSGTMVTLSEPKLLNNGEANIPIASLTADQTSHIIQAIYSGDSKFNAATAVLRQYVFRSLAGIKYVVVQLSPYYCDGTHYHDELEQLIANQVVSAERNANLVQQNATLAGKYLTPDPPFEAIGQSLNFVVTVGASASPNWSLARWKGPSNSGTLASLMGVRTHSLNIAMGPVTGTTEVNRVLDNAATRQAIQGLQQ